MHYAAIASGVLAAGVLLVTAVLVVVTARYAKLTGEQAQAAREAVAAAHEANVTASRLAREAIRTRADQQAPRVYATVLKCDDEVWQPQPVGKAQRVGPGAKFTMPRDSGERLFVGAVFQLLNEGTGSGIARIEAVDGLPGIIHLPGLPMVTWLSEEAPVRIAHDSSAFLVVELECSVHQWLSEPSITGTVHVVITDLFEHGIEDHLDLMISGCPVALDRNDQGAAVVGGTGRAAVRCEQPGGIARTYRGEG